MTMTSIINPARQGEAHTFRRNAVGVPLAAGITFGLFSLMSWLISSDYQRPEAEEARTIARLTPMEIDLVIMHTRNTKPKRLISANQPPPPPKRSTTKSQIKLPTPTISGVVPTELIFDKRATMAIPPVAINDHDAQPIRPPLPIYPIKAAKRGVEGSCDVRLDVDIRGRPFNVEATCSDAIFSREAVRAVQKVQFAPKVVRGKAYERRNVIYPLEFTLKQ